MANPFQLSSSQTALALILPNEVSDQINDFRRKHDKAFHKWPAHINILYPFVPAHKLELALESIRRSLKDDIKDTFEIRCDDLGVFKHKKSATLFLRPNAQSIERLDKLRKLLISALGCKVSDGIHDGNYLPHVTLGQSDLTHNAIDALMAKASSLVGTNWTGLSLAVLRRQGVGGPMTVVEEIPFSKHTTKLTTSTFPVSDWKPCYKFTKSSGWTMISQDDSSNFQAVKVVVTSINIMEEEHAPDFASRLPTIAKCLERLHNVFNDTPRILCLQEVSPSTLPLILSDEIFRQIYPYSSHCPASLLPSTRNQITLASVPFKQFTLPFAEMHKAVIIAQLCGTPISVINVHLSSGLSTDLIETKRRQISKLSAFIFRRKLANYSIIAGDFNIPTSLATLHLAVKKKIVTLDDVHKLKKDVISNDWNDAFLVNHSNRNTSALVDETMETGEEGATFDRLANPLSAMNLGSLDDRPQRYDRILYHKHGALNLGQYFMTTLRDSDGQFASDHYGITASFSVDESQSGQAQLSDVPRHLSIDELRSRASGLNQAPDRTIIDMIDDNTDVHELIERYIPTVEDDNRRRVILDLLSHALNQGGSSAVELLPIGSFAMNIHFSDSDIDVLAVASMSSETFFDHAKAVLADLKMETGQSTAISTFTILVNSKVPILEVEVAGIKVDVQYCKKDASLSGLDCSYNSYRDMTYIKESISPIVHRYLALFLKRRGLYSAKFGYLGGIHLALMVNHLLKTIALQNEADSKSLASELTPASIIRTFFHYFTSFDWARRIVADPSVFEERTNKVDRHHRPMYIRSIFTPSSRINVAESCTIFSVKLLTREFEAARDALAKGEWRWCLRPTSESLSDFLNNADVFIQVQLDIWNLPVTSATTLRNITGLVESKLLHVCDKLSFEKDIFVQIWPARFRSTQEEADKTTGHYLISIAGELNDDIKTDLDMKKLSQVAASLSSLIKRARTWQDTVAGLQVSVAAKKKILEQGLVIDDRDWNRSASHDDGLTTSETDPKYNSDHTKFFESTPVMKSTEPDRAMSGPTTSLRPVQDILARINWDMDNYNSDDYVIGYEDRFEGIMQLPLAVWKRESTDEEFIPLHRIVWIKKKGDGGEKVWDRHTRFDAIFGSGRQQT